MAIYTVHEPPLREDQFAPDPEQFAPPTSSSKYGLPW